MLVVRVEGDQRLGGEVCPGDRRQYDNWPPAGTHTKRLALGPGGRLTQRPGGPFTAMFAINAGWVKASHRFGHERLAPVRPGMAYDLPVHVWPTHYRVEAGHRLQVTVSNLDYPEIDSDAPTGRVTVTRGTVGITPLPA